MKPNPDSTSAEVLNLMADRSALALKRVISVNQGLNRKGRRALRAKNGKAVIAVQARLRAMWKRVKDFFDGDKAKTELWFRTSNPMIGDVAPFELIQRGQLDKLERCITASLAGTPLP